MFLQAKNEFTQSTATAPVDRVLPLSGAVVSQNQPMDPPLVADYDGDGRNEIIQLTLQDELTILKAPTAGQPDAREVTNIKGILANPGSKSAGPLFADLDDDGKLEMIATRLQATTATAESNLPKEQPCVEVTKADGTLVWRKTWPADFKGKFLGSQWGFGIGFLAVGHFTGKNPLDVALCYSGEQQGANIAVLDGAKGNTIWSIHQLYPGMYGEAWDFNAPVVLDYDGDGLDDLATTPQTVHYTVLRGTDGKQLLDAPRDVTSQNFGAKEVGEKALFPKGWTTGPLLGAGDADGDGKPELAVFSSQACVGVFRPDGEHLWFLNLLVTNQVPAPGCWVDVDGDGKDEVAFIHKEGVVRVYEGMTGAVRWEENLNTIGPMIAADVDGEGGQEILFSSEKGKLICLSNIANAINGSHIKWSLDLKAVPAQAIFVDVSGDGVGEILVPTSDGYLNCLGAGNKVLK